jgi:hypothetical protein
MPIKIRAVSKEAFAKWVGEAKQKFALENSAPSATQVAAAQ